MAFVCARSLRRKNIATPTARSAIIAPIPTLPKDEVDSTDASWLGAVFLIASSPCSRDATGGEFDSACSASPVRVARIEESCCTVRASVSCKIWASGRLVSPTSMRASSTASNPESASSVCLSNCASCTLITALPDSGIISTSWA